MRKMSKTKESDERKEGERMFEVTIMKAGEVADIFHTTAPKIKAAILNGTLPIGFVADDEKRDRIIIVKKRLEAWINAKDLGV